MSDPIIVFCTAGSMDEATEIGRCLVNEKLAACVNLSKNLTSIYRWKNEIYEENEIMLIIKSDKRRLDELIKRIQELHSYEVPEIIALPIIAGNEDYLTWLNENVKN